MTEHRPLPQRHPPVSARLLSCAGIAASLGLFASAALSNPVTSALPSTSTGDKSCVAAATLAGYFAAADSFTDSIELRDQRLNLLRTISRADLQALAPFLDLSGGPDGPSALAFSSTGRLLFILAHDDTPSTSGPSDAIFRYDVSTNTLGLFVRLEAFDRGDQFPHLAMAHHKGRLYVGTRQSAANTGSIVVYSASASATSSLVIGTWFLPANAPVRGITIDRQANLIFASSDSAVYRAAIPASASTQPSWVQIAAASDIRALAWGDHFGAAANRGLYVLTGAVPNTSSIGFVSAAGATGSSIVPITPYLSGNGDWHDLAATADGRLLLGAQQDPSLIADDADTRLGFDAWIRDELARATAFARGLISPDGEPAGWVIDADVVPGANRFHPATPDGAAWCIMLLLMNQRVNSDPLAQQTVRSILTRYAGLSTDNIRPTKNSDGIMRHWIDPFSGNAKSGWDPEFATLSSMLLNTAAARAQAAFPNDPLIANAASRLLFRPRNWDLYIQPGTDALYFKGLQNGGPDTASFSRPFFEGLSFIEQASVYGGSAAKASYARWINRSLWPTATFVNGMPITSTSAGGFGSAFISIYPALTSADFRASPAWRTQIANIRWSNAAWTDDNGPRYSTVFSAGTTRSDWGGYNADSLGNHPGNVTTFTSLMGLSAFGDVAPALGAYHAYRVGARQTFKSGASILYRASDIDRTYVPNSAGLPDVGLGAIALCELISPGLIDQVLATPYPTLESCAADLNADGLIDVEDLYVLSQALVDLNGDGLANNIDIQCLRNWLRRNERVETSGR